MRKVIIVLFLVFLVFSYLTPVHAEKVAVISDILKPDSIAVDDSQLYVVEGATVFIYSLKDYKLVTKFGREGQGPQEFAKLPGINVAVDATGKNLLINSFGKISYFKKDGTFEKEIKAKGLAFYLRALKDGYAGMGRAVEDGVVYNTINLFDAELNPVKEIARMKVMKTGGKIQILKRSFSFQVYKDQLYVVGEEGLSVDVYDHTGKKLRSITHPYEKLKFEPKAEEVIRANMKRQYGPQYEALKNNLDFPDYFPEIRNLFVDDGKVVVSTWKNDNGKIELYIFDLKGNLVKKNFIKMAVRDDGMTPYPTAIQKNKLYQLIENEDEEWEFHISKLDL